MATDLPVSVLRDFREVLGLLRARRGMYIGDGFDALVAFIVGYAEATKRNIGVELIEPLQDYVKAAYGVNFAVMWPYYLADEVAQGDEAQATLLVFSFLDDFISEQLLPEE